MTSPLAQVQQLIAEMDAAAEATATAAVDKMELAWCDYGNARNDAEDAAIAYIRALPVDGGGEAEVNSPAWVAARFDGCADHPEWQDANAQSVFRFCASFVRDRIATPAAPEPVAWRHRGGGGPFHPIAVKCGALTSGGGGIEYITHPDPRVEYAYSAPPAAVPVDEARDAARYRYLRDVAWHSESRVLMEPRQHLDAAIDTALAQSPQSAQGEK